MSGMEAEEAARTVIGAAIRVHRALGPGLLESAYEACLAFELHDAGLKFERQPILPVRYRGLVIDAGYRPDFVVESRLVVELKAVEKTLPIHEAQVLTYLRLADCSLGLLLNFNVELLKDGIRRLVLNHPR